MNKQSFKQSSKKRKYILKKHKERIVMNQGNKCANIPDNPAANMTGYTCLLWKYKDGTFDEAGYQIDHIVEYCEEQNNNIDNLQALCPNCHAVKTKRYMMQNKPFDKPRLNSLELHQGGAWMDLESEYSRDEFTNMFSKKRKLN